jgi:hypothetical protein
VANQSVGVGSHISEGGRDMSVMTWLKEYYPVAASQVPEAEALEHTKRKWVGLRLRNLQRHGLSQPPIPVNSATCALCTHYLPRAAGDPCTECPLYKVRQGVRCDTATRTEEMSPYRAWKDNNAEPMIGWLEQIP